MARPHLSVSRAGAADAGVISEMWIESSLAEGLSHDLAARAANAGRIQEALERPGTTVLLATQDGAPIGFAVVNLRQHGLLEQAALGLDELYVRPEARRQGVAAHLLGAVARLAEGQGQEVIFATVAANDKVSNRYFARRGFAAASTSRMVPTAVLRRKLAGTESAARDVLLGRRRTLRARTRVASQLTPSAPRGRAAG